MGGAVSAGINNDELIDNLVEAGYIKSIQIEEIFRAVDRGDFYIQEYRENAYQDMAWKHDHIHISAPCIYSEVMGALSLRPGLSFLNVGSGTGYLSTMAGLMLGCHGINHGIEIHDDVVDYAEEKVGQFMRTSLAFDRYSFCEPEFVVGNCLDISPDVLGYDRIYCGAGCPNEHKSFLTNLLNINGILVVPLSDQLQAITRTGQTTFESKNILPVNFATLVVPVESKGLKSMQDNISASRLPPTLQAICRGCIRKVISDKYHSGSNRKHRKRKKKPADDEKSQQTKSRPSLNNLSSSSSGSDDSDNEDQPADSSQFGVASDTTNQRPLNQEENRNEARKRNLILNIVTKTVTAVCDPQSPDFQASSSPGAGASSSSQEKMDTNNSNSDSEKKERLKKVKRSCYPFLRLRHKTKKTNNTDNGSKVDNTHKIRKVTGAGEQGDGDAGSTMEHDQRPAGVAANPDVQTESRVNIHLGSDSTSLVTFLDEMDARCGTTSRTPGLFLGHMSERHRDSHDSSASESDSYETDDVNPTLQEFYHAVLKLPVPDAVKHYLLYYR